MQDSIGVRFPSFVGKSSLMSISIALFVHSLFDLHEHTYISAYFVNGTLPKDDTLCEVQGDIFPADADATTE
jgi:hypothetical protein